jgi:hypothetical protein
MNAPPGNEKPALPGGSLTTDYTVIVNGDGQTFKKYPPLPAGYGFEDGFVRPTVEPDVYGPPDEETQPRRLTQGEREAYLALLREGEGNAIAKIQEEHEAHIQKQRIADILEIRALRWAILDAGKIAAVDSYFLRDLRPPADLAAAAKVSPSTFFRHLKRLRALIDVWRAELEEVQ